MLETIVKAFIVGSSMMIPGVSGGSMAMILGIYDKLIDAVPNLFVRNKCRSAFIFLLVFVLSAFAGILIVARPLEILMTDHALVMSYLFLGAVFGTVPMMVEKAKMQGFDPVSLLYIALGVALVISISLIPEGMFSPNLDASFANLAIQFTGGLLVSVGLVLPGISTSYLLLVLGLYESILDALSMYDFISLVPIAMGVVAGILALTKILQIAMRKYPKPTYMIILGFLLASLREIYAGLPTGWYILFCLLLFLLGFSFVYRLSKLEQSN